MTLGWPCQAPKNNLHLREWIGHGASKAMEDASNSYREARIGLLVRGSTVKRIISRFCAGAVAAGILCWSAPGTSGEMAGRGQDEESAQIFIESSGFEPANLNIPTGTTVTWTNHDGMAHTVFNTDKVFISEMLDTGEKYSFVFHKAGTYPYHCSIHSKMTGTVNVK